jgi:hypothetical protein
MPESFVNPFNPNSPNVSGGSITTPEGAGSNSDPLLAPLVVAVAAQEPPFIEHGLQAMATNGLAGDLTGGYGF